jgi:hypothetical protein
MTLATIEACLMMASLDLPVQLNLHVCNRQSWQASEAVSIDVLGSSLILEHLSGSADLASAATQIGQIDSD